MSTVPLVEYEMASLEVKAIFDDIKRTRNVQDVNNFWKALANHPDILKRTWETLQEVIRPGTLDALTKELIYMAVFITNKCDYCIHSHTAAAFAKGMTSAQYQELLSVVGMAHQTKAFSTGMKIPVDQQFLATATKEHEEQVRVGWVTTQPMSYLSYPTLANSNPPAQRSSRIARRRQEDGAVQEELLGQITVCG